MVDDTIEAYVDWREECAHVSEAYRRWLSAVGADAALAFRAYGAALEREERAAEVYADLIGRVGRVVAAAPQSVTGHPAAASGASQQ
jgi:hypothetical protein